MTKKPCPGCGQTWGRPIDKVCSECERELAYAKECREITSVAANDWPGRVVLALETHTGFYGKAMSDQFEKEARLGDTFVACIKSLLEPYKIEGSSVLNARHRTIRERANERKPKDSWGFPSPVPEDEAGLIPVYHVPATPKKTGDQRPMFYVVTVEQALFIQRLDGLIRRYLDNAYERGFDQGRSLLSALNAGEITLDDFNATAFPNNGGRVART